MKRRKFVFLSAASCAFIALPGCNYKNENREPDLLADPQSLSYIWDTTAIINIGKRYRSKFPKEDNEQSLIKLLYKKPSNEKNIIEVLKQRIRTDFETSNTIMIDGWILALTETRQCALFSIIN